MIGPDSRRSLVDLLRENAMRLPDHRVFTFLGTGGAEEEHLTYGQLNAHARAIGAMLQSFGAHGERVLLLYPPGLEFVKAFFGCLYSGAIPVPVPSANRRPRSLRVLQAIIADARPSFALTTSVGLGFVKQALRELMDARQLRWLATDILAPDLQHEWWDPGVTGEHIAYLQYTSGSTSTPKGVILRHHHVLDNSVQISRALEYDDQSVAVMWLPHFHDNGLVHGIIQPLVKTFRSLLMSPTSFVQHPFRWLEAISRYRATHSGGPNFAYALCTRRVLPHERSMLDLSSWRFAYNAAEPVQKKTLNEFAAAFAPCGFRATSFYPAYGLAEATLLVSIKRRGADLSYQTVAGGVFDRIRSTGDGADTERRAQPVIGCGPSVADTRIAIACPNTLMECPPGVEGEVWVSGPSVAAGYWNRPDESERTFNAFLAGSGEGPFLRTGDLGYIRDNELFVTGRIKDLIIVRGQNHYPQDIESTVEETHPAIRTGCCAAFSINLDENEGLVIVAELQSPRAPNANRAEAATVDPSGLREAIRQAVADAHGLHVHAMTFIPPGAIPKTSSGKIQRQACKADFLAGIFEALGAAHGNETRL